MDHRMLLKRVTWLALVCCLAHPSLAPAQKTSGLAATSQSLDESLRTLEKGVEVTLWIGGRSGRSSFERGATTVMPTASAIKTFYLVELFARHESNLDAPVGDADRILTDDHPAISHFPAAVRDEIRRELSAATVRRIGQIMMGRTDVSNAVYNAAANLVTAHLGGPEKLTDLIHARDSRFQSVVVRRYMLRDRTKPGDNEATAASFAALYQALSSRKLNGVSDSVMTALHEVLRRGEPSDKEPLYEKDGGLGSEPLTAVKAGWKQTSRGPVVFVVMCRQSLPDPSRRTEAYEELRKLSITLRDKAFMATSRVTEQTSDSLETVRANLRDRKAVLLDVRDQDEWDAGHVADAKLVPLRLLDQPGADDLLQSVPKDRIIYTYCARGRRALDAGKMLNAKGYDARPLSAGYDELLKNGFEKAK
jgi:rhodanese-related sulfurtransferase